MSLIFTWHNFISLNSYCLVCNTGFDTEDNVKKLLTNTCNKIIQHVDKKSDNILNDLDNDIELLEYDEDEMLIKKRSQTPTSTNAKLVIC